MNGNDTRRILNKAHTAIHCPHNAGGKIKYLLEEYVGLDGKHIAYATPQRANTCTSFYELAPMRVVV